MSMGQLLRVTTGSANDGREKIVIYVVAVDDLESGSLCSFACHRRIGEKASPATDTE
jgi:hypothetical protein